MSIEHDSSPRLHSSGSSEWTMSAIEIFKVECYLIARHYPWRYKSFSK